MMKPKVLSLLLMSMLVFCSAQALARSEGSPSGDSPLPADEQEALYARGAPALALFLLAGLAGYGLLVWNRRRGTQKDSTISVVAVKPLGQRERIAIVEILGERVVLGVTPHGISLLMSPPKGFSRNPAVKDEPR
jgi:flagellar biogenesis protein FliO